MTTERSPSKAMHPNRDDYPAVAPVVCAKGPFLNSASPRDRAGHCYTRVDGIWICRNCEEARP